MMFDKNVSKAKKAAVIIALLALCAGTVTAYINFGQEMLAFLNKPEEFRAWLNSFGGWSEAVFVAVRALQTVVKIIPAEPLEIGSGYAFGTMGGLLWCMMGTEIGSLAILLLSKFFGEKFIRLFVPEDKMKSFNFLKKKSNIYAVLFVIYLIPGSPKDLITYFAWMLPINIPTFLLITGIARIPSIVTSTMCGAALGEKNYTAAAIIFAVTTLVSIIGLAIYRKYETKHNGEADESL